MHVTKTHAQTVILLVRAVREDTSILVLYSDINIGSLLTVREKTLVLSINARCSTYAFYTAHLTFKWMHFPITLAKQQHHMVFGAFLITQESFIPMPV